MRPRGSSLVEVIIASALVAALLLAMASIFPMSLGGFRKSQTTVVGSNLAKSLMEQYKGMDWADLVANMTPPPTTTTINEETYTQTVTILHTLDPNVLEVHVLVTWDSGGNFGKGSVQYNTCVFNVENPW